MTLLKFLPLFLLASMAVASIITSNKLVITRKFFLESNVKYTGKHDIVNIDVPLNSINFDDDDDSDDSDDNTHVTVFFAEADVNDNGQREYQGLYILKNGVATKILENGRDAAAFNDDSKKAYLGASDGVYVYDGTNGTTNKYGSLTDNIVQIEADNQTSTIYFVTEDNQVFSISDEGTKKNKVEDLKDVKEIIIDFNSNIFYYDSKKDLYVFGQDGVKKFNGLPKRNEIKLIKPMFAQDEGVFAIVDDTLYFLNANGTSEKSQISFRVKPTAYAPEATLIHYYALDKKIYEFNVMEILASDLTDLKNFLDDKTNEIQTIATMGRSSFGA